MEREKNVAIIVGSGNGSRFGLDKIFVEIDNKPVWYHAAKPFQECREVDEIVLVVREENVENVNQKKEILGLDKIKKVISGGKTRKDSVVNGLDEVGSFRTDLVLVHDAARPLVSIDLIERCVDKAKRSRAAVPGILIRDTVKIGGSEVLKTVDRNDFRLIQTPQVFDYKLLREAYYFSDKNGFEGTDDASYVENFGARVSIVEGQDSNIKITYKEDLELAVFWMTRR